MLMAMLNFNCNLLKILQALKSVTATDTVKAGTATVGNPNCSADNKGGTQTGNFEQV